MDSRYGCGVYLITNTTNGNVYVGQSCRVTRRWHQHLSTLRRGIHSNGHLQRAWNKYGDDSFRFDFIEQCDRAEESLCASEQKWVDLLRPEYNIAPVAGTNIGLPMHPNTREALRRASTGRVVSESTRLKIGAANAARLTGKKQPKSQVENRIAPLRGRKRPDVSAKLRGQKRTGYALESLRSGHIKRWASRAAEIREAIAADPEATTTTIANRIKADWATVRKYQQEFRACQP